MYKTPQNPLSHFLKNIYKYYLKQLFHNIKKKLLSVTNFCNNFQY